MPLLSPRPAVVAIGCRGQLNGCHRAELPYLPLSRSGKQAEVQHGSWKLVATYGKTTTYRLYNHEDDPAGTQDLSEKLEQICFRIRGVLERQQELEFQAEMRGKSPGSARK